jgi:hypothetical protein
MRRAAAERGGARKARSCAAAVVTWLSILGCSPEPPKPLVPVPSDRPRVLFLTHSAGYRHDVLPLAQTQLKAALRGSFEVDLTEDCGTITKANLARYAAVVFFTSGELAIDREALFDYVKGGGGFAGIHSATDTLAKEPRYGAMIGGVFKEHPWTQNVSVRKAFSHPSTEHLPGEFEIDDEIYTFRDWSAGRCTPLLTVVPESVGALHETPLPLSWVREDGKGRVFYTALGHRPEVWRDERFLRHVAEGVIWASEAGFEALPLSRFRFFQAGPAFAEMSSEIVCSGTPAGYMYTDASYRDFTMRFDWKYDRPAGLANDAAFPGNGGILLWICGEHRVWPACLEVQGMWKDAGKIIPLFCGATFRQDDAAQLRSRRPVGEWNTMEIVSRGGRARVSVNGVLVAEVDACDLKEGPIGFQSEGAPLRWRNIRIGK